MTDEVYEYQQSMKEQAMAAHRTPISPTEQELPEIPDFWERLEWAVKNSGKTRNAISYEIGANTDYISYSLRNRSEIRADKADPLAKALGVDKEWLFKKTDSHKRKKRNERIAPLIESVKDDMLDENITYQEMAKRIGVNKTSLYEWVSGKKTPRGDNVKKSSIISKTCRQWQWIIKRHMMMFKKMKKPKQKVKKSCSGLKAYTRLKRWLLLYQS